MKNVLSVLVNKASVSGSGFRSKAAIGLAGCLLLGAVQMSAVPITGEIHFGGSFTPVDSGGFAASLGSATGIDFANPGVVIAGSGDFGSFTPFVTTVVFTDFQFNPLSPSPVDPLWTVGGFNFTLTDIHVTGQSDLQLGLLGTGIISGNGFDATYGTWNFTGNATSTLFSFSADSEALNAVPDGGNTLLLLGAAFLGMGLVASRMTRATGSLC